MLKVLRLTDCEEWDAIVKSFEHWDVYYLSGYVRAFAIHGDGEPLLLYFDNSETRAINSVMKRDVAEDRRFSGKIEKGKYFDLATPYGYGGWLVEGDNLDALDKEYSSYCISENIVSEFVRFSPVVGNADKVRKMYNVIDYSKTIAIDTGDKDAIWTNFEGRNRTSVRHAQNEGVTIKQGNDAELYNSFVKLYNTTMARDNATDYYYFKESFYDSVRNDLSENAKLFYAEYNGEIIAASIIMYANKHVHYHLSASDREYQRLSPTNLLLYTVATWAADNGYEYFHLGGGVGGAADNLLRFKMAFNKKSDFTFCLGKKIFSQDVYDTLVKIRKNNDGDFNEQSTFFPLYRG